MLYSMEHSMCSIACYIAALVFNPRQIHHSRPELVASTRLVIFPSLNPPTLQSLCSPRASVRDGSLPLQLGLGDSTSTVTWRG